MSRLEWRESALLLRQTDRTGRDGLHVASPRLNLLQMQGFDHLRHLLDQLLADPLLQQLFPLLVVLFVPLLILTANAYRAPLADARFMVVDAKPE